VNRVFPVAPLVCKYKNIVSRLAQDLTQQRAVAVVRIICAVPLMGKVL